MRHPTEYVFFGGKRIAWRNIANGNVYYYAEDTLGSSRTIVQAGQTNPCYDADFPPFGSERDVASTCSQNYKFEGKERDTETGNDDFGARYYASRLGRWLSADWSAIPAPVPYANLANPQTLNLYAMVSDNPETFADLAGHATIGTESFPEGMWAAIRWSSNLDPAGCVLSNTCDGPDNGSPAWDMFDTSNSEAAGQQGAQGLEFIERHEGYSDKVYNGSAGNPTDASGACWALR